MRLTRGDIVAAAMDLIEHHGAAAVSMQRLASELGCGALALYGFIGSRSDLLDAIATEIMSGVECAAGAGTADAPPDEWPAALAAQVRAYRQAARAYPQCALTVAGRPLVGAAAARPVERALGTLAAAGLAGPEALRTGRVLSAYVLGTLLREAGRDVPPADLPPRSRDLRLRPSDFPHVTALATELATRDCDAEFEFGLTLLIQAIAARAQCS